MHNFASFNSWGFAKFGVSGQFQTFYDNEVTLRHLATLLHSLIEKKTENQKVDDAWRNLTILDLQKSTKGASIYDVRTEGGGGLAQKKM